MQPQTQNCIVMDTQMFGRKKESDLIREYLQSERSEFVAVYGRRRIGKTFLLRTVLAEQATFCFTGMANISTSEQLQNFSLTLRQYEGEACNFRNWQEAFYGLQNYLERQKSEKKVVFFDELPWIDTPKSNFIPAFEHFWNSWASARSDVKLFVCGSAASWMLNNVINSHGGLHNRITHQMLLEPFSLKECKEYFLANHFGYSDKEIAEFYMVFGGVPYYLSLMDKQLSVAQNIDRLIFSSTGELVNEKHNMFRSLFRRSEDYMLIVDTLSEKTYGLTRSEILEATKLNNNALFSKRLEELEECHFIRHYEDYSRRQRQVVYQLTDPLCHFWHKIVEKNNYQDPEFWSHSILSPLYNAWSGLAFEILCLNQVQQIKQALGIGGIQSRVYSWRLAGDGDKGAQVDLVIDRADQCVNICEMKFSRAEYELTKTERERIENCINRFVERAEPHKSIRLTMITSYGLKPNTHSAIIQNSVTLADLMQ